MFGGEALETGEVLGSVRGGVVSSAIEWPGRSAGDAVEGQAAQGGEDTNPCRCPPGRASRPDPQQVWPRCLRAVVKDAPKMFLCGGSAASGHAWLCNPPLSRGPTQVQRRVPSGLQAPLCSLPDGAARLAGGIRGRARPAQCPSSLRPMAWSTLGTPPPRPRTRGRVDEPPPWRSVSGENGTVRLSFHKPPLLDAPPFFLTALTRFFSLHHSRLTFRSTSVASLPPPDGVCDDGPAAAAPPPRGEELLESRREARSGASWSSAAAALGGR